MRSLNHSWLGILVILCLYFSSWFHGEIKMDSRHPLHFKQSSFTLWGVDTVFRRCSFLRRNAHIIPVITTFNLVIALTKRNHLNQPWWGNIASSCCSRGFLHPPSPPPLSSEGTACLLGDVLLPLIIDQFLGGSVSGPMAPQYDRLASAGMPGLFS